MFDDYSTEDFIELIGQLKQEIAELKKQKWEERRVMTEEIEREAEEAKVLRHKNAKLQSENQSLREQLRIQNSANLADCNTIRLDIDPF